MMIFLQHITCFQIISYASKWERERERERENNVLTSWYLNIWNIKCMKYSVNSLIRLHRIFHKTSVLDRKVYWNNCISMPTHHVVSEKENLIHWTAPNILNKRAFVVLIVTQAQWPECRCFNLKKKFVGGREADLILKCTFYLNDKEYFRCKRHLSSEISKYKWSFIKISGI